MTYINVKTNQYPVTEQDIRSANPNTSFGSVFNPGEDYQLVIKTDFPEYDVLREAYREVSPVKNENDEWVQTWEVYSLDQDKITQNIQVDYENKANNIRTTRNSILHAIVDPIICNPFRWSSLSDSDKALVEQYRLSLLDITSQDTFPYNVNWPDKPTFLPDL